MKALTITTNRRTEFVEVTQMIQRVVGVSGVGDGICIVSVPHTTAGITINENADPSVMEDVGAALDKLVPWEARWRHTEGNAAAHVKSVLVGSSVQVPVSGGKLQIGTWQGIFFCEFDGPRTRTVHVSVIADK